MAKNATKSTTAKVEAGTERRKALTPEAAADPVAKIAAAQLNGPKDAEEVATEAARAGEKLVVAIIPHAFRLTLDDGREVAYPQGTIKMPASHFEHWYSKANGVTAA